MAFITTLKKGTTSNFAVGFHMDDFITHSPCEYTKVARVPYRDSQCSSKDINSWLEVQIGDVMRAKTRPKQVKD